MKNTTNILMLVVIILLVALFVDKRLENNTLRADGGGAINNIIFAMDPLVKERFFLVNTEKKNMLYYEYDQSTKSILLKAARSYDFDELIVSPYTVKVAQGDSYAVVKSVFEAKPKK